VPPRANYRKKSLRAEHTLWYGFLDQLGWQMWSYYGDTDGLEANTVDWGSHLAGDALVCFTNRMECNIIPL
jgi:hypothetical protein